MLIEPGVVGWIEQAGRFALRHAEDIGQLTGAGQALATVAALTVGGAWTYWLFVRNRLGYPRAEVHHALVQRSLDATRCLLHVEVKVINKSSVRIEIVRGEVRLALMLPLARELTESLARGETLIDASDPEATEICWPDRQRIAFNWEKNPREIEPGEEDSYHYDFILAAPCSVFQVYSHIENVSKRQRKIGWNTTTIHDLEAEELDVLPGSPVEQPRADASACTATLPTTGHRPTGSAKTRSRPNSAGIAQAGPADRARATKGLRVLAAGAVLLGLCLARSRQPSARGDDS